MEIIKLLDMYVPKLHGHGHIDNCKNAIDVQQHVGRTHGERIESGWSRENAAGKASCEMTAGHRHEFLSDDFNEANYQQMIKISEMHSINVTNCLFFFPVDFLSRSWDTACKEASTKRKHYEGLKRMAGEKSAVWDATWDLESKPREVEGEVKCIFKPKSSKSKSVLVLIGRLLTFGKSQQWNKSNNDS